MQSEEKAPQQFRRHVLLIGIDDYPGTDGSAPGGSGSLEGSVNDIDAFESLLLNRLGVQPEDIKKLVSPLPGMVRPRRVSEMPATSENILRAFEDLAENTRANDRVLIYYAGHGGKRVVTSGSSRYFREGLVPSDIVTKGRLVWDYEINGWLAGIASKGGDLTVIFDCCHAAGVPRSCARVEGHAWRRRGLEIEAGGIVVPYVEKAHPRGIPRPSMNTWDPGYSLLAACHADEAAYEVRDGSNRVSGMLSAVLYRILSAYSDEKLQELRWGEVIATMKMIENIADTWILRQRPWFVGRKERLVFGGPFIVQDQGIGVFRAGAKYQIQAGAWAGFSKGALVAVYGENPPEFPPIGSPEEKDARIGLMRVEQNSGMSSEAVVDGVPFEVPPGARARLIQPASSERLKVVLSPYQKEPAKYIGGEGLFAIIPPDLENEADVVINILPGNAFRLSDPKDKEQWAVTGAAPLFESMDLDSERLSALLHHYQYYLQPLRIGRALSTPSATLKIRLLDATGVSKLPKEQLQALSLPEIPPDSAMMGVCKVWWDQPMCFAVENNQPQPLSVSLLRCTAGGSVELLGSGNELVAPMGKHIIYEAGELGQPFRARPHGPSGASLDRYIAIGTDQKGLDVSGFVAETNRDFKKAHGPATRHHSRELAASPTWLTAMLYVLVLN